MATLLSSSSSENNNLRDATENHPLRRKKEEDENNNPRDVTENHPLRRKKEEEDGDGDGEIGVFSAEKYFNGVIQEVDHSPRISRFNINPPNKYEHEHPKMMMMIKQEIYLAPPSPKLHPESSIPSARSESSSNSRNALMQHKSQSQSQSQSQGGRKTKKSSNGKSFLAGLGCNCMCSNSDSIDVEDERREISSKKKADDIAVENSLQVFGSPLQQEKKSSSRSFGMLRDQIQYSSTTSYINEDEDGDESHGSSSDLFEIESITGKGNYYPAPSEASIEWSVVTASAADFSLISDYEDINIVGPNPKTAAGAGETRRRGGISLGCKNSKAVRVADRISNDQPLRRVSDSYMPPLENEFDHSTLTQRRVLSFPRSHPHPHPHPHHHNINSPLFYIH